MSRIEEAEESIRHIQKRLVKLENITALCNTYHPTYEPPKPKTPKEVRLVFVFGTIVIFLHIIHLLVTTWK